jgi:hypothetical protein
MRVFPNVAIISLNPFIGRKLGHQGISEDHDIIPHSTFIWPFDTDNVTSQDTEANFISDA